MKTLTYTIISLMAVVGIAGCGKSNNNNPNYYNPNMYGTYGANGGCLPTGVTPSQPLCQQYGYSFNGSSCIGPQGQMITPGMGCTTNYGYSGYGNYPSNYNYSGYGYQNYPSSYSGYSGYNTGYYYTTPYGYSTYVP